MRVKTLHSADSNVNARDKSSSSGYSRNFMTVCLTLLESRRSVNNRVLIHAAISTINEAAIRPIGDQSVCACLPELTPALFGQLCMRAIERSIEQSLKRGDRADRTRGLRQSTR